MVTLKDELVEFSFYRPGANEVFIIGDFNGWQYGAMSMERQDDGYWLSKLELPPGEFKFRYFADGQWFTDYAAFGVEPGVFGFDSVVRVPRRTLKVASEPVRITRKAPMRQAAA